MSESERRSTQQLFSQAKAIHSSNRTSSNELENKLEFMQRSIEDYSSFLNCSFCRRSNKGVDQAYKRAFKSLSLSEQVMLFWRICKIIKDVKQKPKLENQTQIKNTQKETLDTTIYIKDKRDYKVWTVTRVKASLRTKKIVITDTSVVLDMHDYLIRSVKSNDRQCFALEATNSKQPYQTIKVSNEGHSLDETYKFFKKMKKKALYDEICSQVDPLLLHQQQAVEISVSSKVSRQAPQKVLTYSTGFDQGSMFQKMMTFKLISPQYSKTPAKQIQKQMLQKQRVIRLRDSSYNQIHKYLLPSNLINSLDVIGPEWQQVKKQDQYEVYYNRVEQKVKKIYRFKSNQIIIFDWIVDELNNFSNFRKWKPKMEKINCLRVFPSEKTKVYHEVCRHQGNKKMNYAFVRHHFDLPGNTSNGGKPKKVCYFYDQSVVAPIAKEYFSVPEPLAEISYIIWKFYEHNDTVNLVVEAKCDHFTTPQNNFKMMENFLGDFERLKNHAAKYDEEPDMEDTVILNTVLFEDQYIQRIDQIENVDDETEYFTIYDEPMSSNTELMKKTPDMNRSTQMSRKIQKRVSFQVYDTTNEKNLLKFRHPLVPYKKTKPYLRMPKTSGGHFQWQFQWQINKKGELISTNKQKIQAQNDVLKNVFKSLGRNIFSGKGILSISLPVNCFGDDSNLSRLCNSYGYAPIFLEEAAKFTDPLERFKKVISFAISSTVIYIRMDKPFNPILGETYQSLIDGCPVYGQQISHHPPISAVFLKGRGYSLFGHLEAKIEMSLNSASGLNEGDVRVSFNENDYQKDQIMYTAPAGQMAGLVYGDRKMSLIKKSFFFDPTNMIFCQIKWSKHKGKSKFSNDYYDAVEGRIVKLKPGFDPKRWKSVKKEDIEREFGLINGRWTGAVYYDDQLLFDTYKMFPHKVEPYHALLESDVSKRKDLILRRTATADNMEQAQKAKEELEEIQRNDRKLRAKYGKGGH